MATGSLIRFDWAMKRLLRNKADYTVLEGFLSVLLNDDIKIINIKESESNQEQADDKFNRVDLLAKDCRGELLIIEIQNSSEVDYLLRMPYGASKAVTGQLKKGDPYGKICKVYHINIVYFRLGDGEDVVEDAYTSGRWEERKEIALKSRQAGLPVETIAAIYVGAPQRRKPSEAKTTAEKELKSTLAHFLY